MLENGADFIVESINGLTQLHVVVEHRRVEVVRVLLEHGAHAGMKGKKGRIAKLIASVKRYEEILELLSEHAKSTFALANTDNLLARGYNGTGLQKNMSLSCTAFNTGIPQLPQTFLSRGKTDVRGDILNPIKS